MGAIKIEIEGRNRIYLRSPNGEHLRAASRIGGNWLEKRGVWSFPLEMHVCKAMRERFDDELEIGPRLWAWAKEQVELQAAAEAVHSLDAAQPVPLPNCEMLAPTLYAAMSNRGYQTIAAQFGSIIGSHFNADQPGTGKTIETFGALIERGVFGRWLVLGPRKAVQSTWPKEVEKWLSPDLDVRVVSCLSEDGSMEERNKIAYAFGNMDEGDIQILLINPEAARVKAHCPRGACKGNDGFCEYKREHKKVPVLDALMDTKWDAIIMDETHKYMMNSNDRAKNVSQVGLGVQTLPLAVGGVKIGLSGTPFKGKPRRFWPMLHWLDPVRYTSQGRWQQHYFETEKDDYAFSGQKITEVMREERRADFNSEMARIMIRRTKQELRALNESWAPPEKRYHEAWVTMDRKQRRLYKAMEDAAAVRLDGGMLMADGVLAEMTRLRQFSIACGDVNDMGEFKPMLPSVKWDWIIDFLDERGIKPEINGTKVGDTVGEDKIIIASQYVKVLEMYAAELTRLRIPHFMIVGKTKGVDAIEDRWQRPYKQGDARVMLLGTAAGGVTLTLDAADDVIINDETWVPDDQEQVEDRAHRTSRTDHQVNVWYVRTEDTIERGLAGDNEWKDATQKRVLDGRRGIEYAKAKWNVNVTNKKGK
jgi:SNF2 family DNA or RNA helicase